MATWLHGYMATWLHVAMALDWRFSLACLAIYFLGAGVSGTGVTFAGG